MESALSYPAQEKVVPWGSSQDIENLRAEVESEEGRRRAKEVIRRTSGAIVTSDPPKPGA